MRRKRASYPKKLEKLVGAALLRDDEFRSLLVKDPVGATRVLGIKLKDDEAQAIKEFMENVDPNQLEIASRRLRGLPNPVGATWLVAPTRPGPIEDIPGQR